MQQLTMTFYSNDRNISQNVAEISLSAVEITAAFVMEIGKFNSGVYWGENSGLYYEYFAGRGVIPRVSFWWQKSTQKHTTLNVSSANNIKGILILRPHFLPLLRDK